MLSQKVWASIKKQKGAPDVLEQRSSVAKTMGLAVMSLVWNGEIKPAGRQTTEQGVTELDLAREVVIERRRLQAAELSL